MNRLNSEELIMPKTLLACTVDGCDRSDVAAKGMCWKHYLRWRRHGDMTVNKTPNKGSKRTTCDGYLMIKRDDVPNRYRGEHVVMAEKALGRPLPPGAEVHHMDRDRTNNNTKSPWNLVICPDHAYHLLLHRRARMLGYEPPVGKLTEKQASEIRSSKLPSRELALMYGISKSGVLAIRSGKIHKVWHG